MNERELAKATMEERLRDGIETVRKIVKEETAMENLTLSEPLLIKGIEVGVSLFIQKEQGKRFKRPTEKKEDEKRMPTEKQIHFLRKNSKLDEAALADLSFDESSALIGEIKEKQKNG